ncbi:MAG: N-acetyl-gamma-glutamyl-phosphate reductase [Christensenellales bacterium]|jgi:N-acetyl-gamma-glutamyl-phosphate reductase
MIKAGIAGATGYVGLELTRILSSHPKVSSLNLSSRSGAGQDMCSAYSSLAGYDLPELFPTDAAKLARECDVVFTALPHAASAELVAELYSQGATVIDMSADFRYDDEHVYSHWYGIAHPCPELMKQAVYGLPELYRETIARSKIIGNPGCYTTCSILALAPLVKHGLIEPSSIVIDAKSGATGAGRSPSVDKLLTELFGNCKAYSVAKHRHTSEIEQELSKLGGSAVTLSFTPHLLPINRGILATSYATLAGKRSAKELLDVYCAFYADEPFVTVLPEGSLPELKHVVGTNRVCIGLAVDERTNRVIVVSALDNLIKGAAGQAVQNMNIVFGFPETEGLFALPWTI